MLISALYGLKDFKLGPMITPDQCAGMLPIKEPNTWSTDALLLPPRVLTQVMNTGVGVEVEVENCHRPALEGWEVEDDASLRNNGAEYKTERGVRVYNLINSVPALCKLAKAGNWAISDRTSIHVHMNVRNLSLVHIQNLLILYSVMEDALFDFASPERKDNIFCIPVYQLGKPDASLEQTIHSWQKYSALNLATIRSYGTVEFRHMYTNYNPNNIMRWVMILGLLKRAALNMDLEEVKAAVTRLKTESRYNQFLESILFGFAKYLPVNPDRMDDLVSNSKMYFFMKENS